MIRNYFLINLILLMIIGFLGVKFHKIYSETFHVPSEAAGKKVQKETAKLQDDDTAPDASRFQAISNMDLFRPSRTPYREDVKQQEILKNPPRLFGTVILGNEKTAILEDPNTKLTRMYRVNETIGGYVISDILTEKVILLSNGEMSEVRLREEKKGLPQVRQMIPPQPPQTQQIQQPAQPQQPQIQPPVQQPVQRPLPPRRPPSRRARPNLPRG